MVLLPKAVPAKVAKVSTDVRRAVFADAAIECSLTEVEVQSALCCPPGQAEVSSWRHADRLEIIGYSNAQRRHH